MHIREIKKRIPFILILMAWLAVIGGGEYILLNYQKMPGLSANPPDFWPSDTSIKRSLNQPTLLMFVHPQCPCTRASIGELALLMTHCRNKLTGRVLFLKPEKFSAQWVRSDLWNDASMIPGVETILDDGGRQAKHFGAQTSGQTLLYSSDGRLIFKGGMTGSRGHSGDNPGRSAVEDLILRRAAENQEHAVFGCSLVDKKLNFFQEVLQLCRNQPKFCPLRKK